eukprot:scaffold16457_cov117-Skeletonema_marinoi.AAC.3
MKRHSRTAEVKKDEEAEKDGDDGGDTTVEEEPRLPAIILSKFDAELLYCYCLLASGAMN